MDKALCYAVAMFLDHHPGWCPDLQLVPDDSLYVSGLLSPSGVYFPLKFVLDILIEEA